jgi:hypothetical protein
MKRGITTQVTLVLAALGVSASSAFGEVFHVDDDADPGGNGTSWGTAFKYLQDALAEASSGDTIWVAQGTYKPGTTPFDSFFVFEAVVIQGGYAGVTEDDPDERDLTMFITTLSGDVDNDGILDADNSRHVVDISVSDSEQELRLDGLRITGGFADGTNGAGIRASSRAARVINSTIENNFASGSGAGASWATLSNFGEIIFDGCTFRNNEANIGVGGGLRIDGQSGTIVIKNCRFSANLAGNKGGALWARSSGDTLSFNLVNTVLDANWAGNEGGGAYVDGITFDMAFNVTNCLAARNGSRPGQNPTLRGGGVFNHFALATAINCTLADNQAHEGGGGWYEDKRNAELDDSVIENGILWGNSAPDGPQLWVTGTAPFTIRNADLEGGCDLVGGDPDEFQFTCEDILDADPVFFDAPGLNYHLCSTSPCLDLGNNAVVPPDDFDVDGDGNEVEDTPDLELGARIEGPPGAAAIVDFGAYEHRCFGDVNEDCVVDVFDLLALLDAWGPCPDCPEDITDSSGGAPDGVVDVWDLLSLLGDWSCGSMHPEAAPQSVYDCINRYGGEPEKLEGCIEAIFLTEGME